jgi:drug/metabolite transporter (DMT)-like permease
VPVLSSTRAWLLVAVAVVGISSSAPVTAATAAPILAVAFWRNLAGAVVSGVWVGAREPGGPAALPGRSRALAVLAGLLLAVHFVTWFSGLRMTSVTVSTALVCTTPIWTVGFDLVRRVPVARPVLLGVGLAMVGVVAITGVDAAGSGRALLGDALSLVGAVAAAAYIAVGARAMRHASTAVYTLLAYACCAALLLPICLLTGTQLVGYAGRTWVELAVIAVGAQVLGHTLLNAAMPRVGVTPLALAILLEVPGASLVAWAWLGQVPALSVLPGTALMLAGLVLVIANTARSAPA